MKKLICILISSLILISSTLCISAEEVTTAPPWEPEPPVTTPPGFIGPPEWDPNWKPEGGTIVEPDDSDFNGVENLPLLKKVDALSYREEFGISEDFYPYVIICEKYFFGSSLSDDSVVTYLIYFLSAPAYVGEDGKIYSKGDGWTCSAYSTNGGKTFSPYLPSTVGTYHGASKPYKFNNAFMCQSFDFDRDKVLVPGFDNIYKVNNLFRMANFKLSSYLPEPDPIPEEGIDRDKYGFEDWKGVEIPSLQEYIDKYGFWGIFKWFERLFHNIMKCLLDNIAIFFRNFERMMNMLKDLIKNMLLSLFIPKEGFFDDIFNGLYPKIEEKFPLIIQITDWLGTLKSTFENLGLAANPPVTKFTLWGHEYEFMNFSAFLPLVNLFRLMFVVFVYFRWIVGLTKRVPPVIGNVSDLSNSFK